MMLVNPYVFVSAGSSLLTFSAVAQNGDAFGYTATVANISDSDRTTGGMATTAGAAWIRVDLGATKTVDRVDLTGNNLAGFGEAGGFLISGTCAKIQTSPDSTSWTTQVTLAPTDNGVTNNTGVSKSFTPVSCRYVRILVDDPSYPRCPIGWLRVYGV